MQDSDSTLSVISNRPHWDGERSTLFFGEFKVKQFKQPATTQRLLLTAFQEESWPPRIDDPLPPAKGNDLAAAKQRLRSAVENLNRAQHGRIRVRFTLDGTGQGICWAMQSE